MRENGKLKAAVQIAALILMSGNFALAGLGIDYECQYEDYQFSGVVTIRVMADEPGQHRGFIAFEPQIPTIDEVRFLDAAGFGATVSQVDDIPGWWYFDMPAVQATSPTPVLEMDVRPDFEAIFGYTLFDADANPVASEELYYESCTPPPPPDPVMRHVSADGSGQYPTIQAAIDAADRWDEVVLQPGTYTGDGNRDLDLRGKSLVVRSSAPYDPAVVAATIIDSQGSQSEPHRGFAIEGPNEVILNGLTVTGGCADGGGGIYISDGRVTIDECRIINNNARDGEGDHPNGFPGGGLYCQSSDVIMRDCELTDNNSGNGGDSLYSEGGAGGGACFIASTVTVQDCMITGNSAGAGGGGEVGIQNGVAGPGGGLFCGQGSVLSVFDSKLLQNSVGPTTGGGHPTPRSAPGCGAGIHCDLESTLELGTVEIRNSTGRGMTCLSQELVINDSIIADNNAHIGQWGGGIYCGAGVIAGTTITNNSSGDGFVDYDMLADGGPGGGIYCEWHIQLNDCIITNNRTGRGLNGPWEPGVTGSSGGAGAGVCCRSATITDCTITGNICGDGANGDYTAGDGGSGGGIYCTLALSIEDSTVSGNRAGSAGGTGPFDGGGPGTAGIGGAMVCASIDAANCIIAGNRTGNGAVGGPDQTVTPGGRGGGISCPNGPMIYCTIADNLTGGPIQGLGGGIWGGPDLRVTDSIIWGNSPDQLGNVNCSNFTYCDVKGSECSAGNGNVSVDPLFAAAGYVDPNGTPENTDDDFWVDGDYHLKSHVGRWNPNAQAWLQDDATSPCIDAGDPSSDPTDEPEPDGNRVNMGAYGATTKTSKSLSLPADHPDFDEWLAVGAPECWGYPRQCHGDVDGRAEGNDIVGRYYVRYNDLPTLIAAWNVKEPPKGPGMANFTAPNGVPGICADFAHDQEGSSCGRFRVHFNDLTILLSNWRVREPPRGPGIPPDCGGTLEP